MSEQESNAYILGTDTDELHRLGLQHEVWSAEASVGWEAAGFSAGQTLLDLGCGPGFCTQELAYIVGPEGKVIGIDQSAGFIEFAQQLARLHQLPIEYRAESFDDMQLQPSSLDGAFCRWALAWIANPGEVIEKVAAALRPGGVFVTHEYIDWSTLSVSPESPAIDAAIAAARESFARSEGDINVGLRVPAMFEAAGIEVLATRPMSRMAIPGTLSWFWPDSFFKNYFPRLVEAGLLDEATKDQALVEWQELAGRPETTCLCPTMVEVIGLKPVA